MGWGGLLYIGSHAGISSTRETKPIQPTIYCCPSLFAELRGSSGWGVGRKPWGYKVWGRPGMLPPTGFGLGDIRARGPLSHTPGWVVTILAVLQITKRIQLVTIYKMQQLISLSLTLAL